MLTSQQLKAEKLRRMMQDDPVLYAEIVLKQRWWPKQVEIARAIVQHKRVFVKASHSIGKTHLGGGLANWHFDCFDPGITLTTAPTEAQVLDLLWKEVRVQRGQLPGLQPKAPRMETAPNHFAHGFTARDANSFQGRHEERLGMIFDEAVGIHEQFWTAGEGMMTGPDCWWLAITNPTETASKAYEEEMSGRWHVITVSAMEHPNIVAELAGLAPPFPAAVRLAWVEDRVKAWCTSVSATDRKKTDFEFPPGSGLWHRPGPLFESRVLGRWPSQATTSIWTEALWELCLEQQPVPEEALQIGCDVARFGDDDTTIYIHRGGVFLHAEAHNGWGTNETAGRLKELAGEHSNKWEDPKEVAIKIDDTGVGGGVTDNANGWNFIPVNSAENANDMTKYPDRRSELWFTSAQAAGEGRIDVSRLDEETRQSLRRQLMAPKYKYDGEARRMVEAKEDTKKRISRSPDDADGFNLALYSPILRPKQVAKQRRWIGR